MHARHDQTVLFRDAQLYDLLSQREQGLGAEIEEVDEDRLLGTPPEALIDYFVQKYGMEMIKIDRDGITVSEHGDVAVPANDFGRPYQATAHGFSFSVPFTGDPTLFLCQGSVLSSQHPRAEIGEGELGITVLVESADPAAVKQKLEQELRLIDQWLGGLAPMVTAHNQKAASEARRRVEARKKRVQDRRGLVSSIGFPVRHRGQQAIPVALARRRLTPRLPATPTVDPEPAITDDDYEAILRTMHQMSLVMERNPAVFAVADEETIRTHFLVQLNGQYEGGATGETFNGNGKTDILVKVDGKNIFIAECKFWKGPDSLHKAIDQLMGYMSWRDTKCSIVVLVRDTEMSTVLQKMPEVVRSHPLYKRERTVPENTWFRANLRHPADANREAVVTLMTFNVPRAA